MFPPPALEMILMRTSLRMKSSTYLSYLRLPACSSNDLLASSVNLSWASASSQCCRVSARFSVRRLVSSHAWQGPVCVSQTGREERTTYLIENAFKKFWLPSASLFLRSSCPDAPPPGVVPSESRSLQRSSSSSFAFCSGF